MQSPYKTNDLFRPGPNTDLNACVGPNGGPYDHMDYASGYFRAALALCAAAGSRSHPVDIAIYPIVYNFRHAVELGLKYLATALPPLWGDTPSVAATHRLTDNWECVREYLRRGDFFDPSATIPKVDAVISDLVDFDPRGEVFRFPVSRSGQQHLTNARIINVEVVRAAIQSVQECFEFWAHRAADYREHSLDYQ